jgi:hypothetical protein
VSTTTTTATTAPSVVSIMTAAASNREHQHGQRAVMERQWWSVFRVAAHKCLVEYRDEVS